MTTTQKRNDPIAFYAVLALVGLAFFANFYHADVPAEAQGIIVLEATATPSLPTPALAAPVIDLALPTPIPPSLPAPAWPADVASVAAPAVTSQEALPAPEANVVEYIDVVGEQAPHSPRGDVQPLDVAQTGPILMPVTGDQPAYIVAPEGSQDVPAAIAVAVPPISADQAAVLAERTSDTCPDGMTFYPRTGCHLEGSGGPMPGAVGE